MMWNSMERHALRMNDMERHGMERHERDAFSLLARRMPRDCAAPWPIYFTATQSPARPADSSSASMMRIVSCVLRGVASVS